MRKKFTLFLVFVACLMAIQVAHAKAILADSKLKVVTTFYPVYEFTKQVLGDTSEVSMLIKAGTEPHDFEPSTKNIASIQKADAFVYMNDNMETWAKKTTKDTNVKVINASEDMLLAKGVAEDDEDEHEGHSHVLDPHVWLSPKRAITLVEHIRDKFVADYPDKADVFKANADTYIKKLEELDKTYTDNLSAAKQKSFVTQHAAFGYLALDYGLKQIPISGLSPDEEPSAKRLASLSKYIKNNGIKYIYFEENASSKVAKTLANEAGVKTKVLNPLESLTVDEEKAGENYISVMKSNLKALKLTTDVEGKEITEEVDSTKTVEKGYFETKDVSDRKLSDWTGDWQSVYPYLEDGTLDSVWDYKAKANKDMTAQEYKTYYTTGYKTDVNKIVIDGKNKTIAFTKDGKELKFTYKYVGYKILTYKKGNRGVRYLFETSDDNAGEFKYVQFSDHGIKSQKAEHFHLFWGSESQEKLLEEMNNWPTYYPSKLTGKEIAQEIVAH